MNATAATSGRVVDRAARTETWVVAAELLRQAADLAADAARAQAERRADEDAP